uniref:hypothetical protein n=1 Tax=Clostridium sp. NkU-1 TaxID=1095009 RepID=UPI000AE6EFD3
MLIAAVRRSPGVFINRGTKKTEARRSLWINEKLEIRHFFPAEAFQKDGGKHLKSAKKDRDGTDDSVYGISGSQ